VSTTRLGDRSVAVLGAGKLGETLIRGLLDAGAVRASRVTVTAAHAERVEKLRTELGVCGAPSNLDAVRGADLVLLAVKPQQVALVLSEIRGALKPPQILISVAASVSTAFIEKHLDHPVPVVRAMPNTPAMLRQGMTAVAPGTHATPEHLEIARSIFAAVGRVVTLDEKHMDAVTGLSASGPAFIYIVIESLAEGGVKVGLPRDVATQLAAQTVLGSGAMVLETGEHPAKLKDLVTTPAGCTIDGILELEDGGLRVTLIKAVVRATRRARELLES
jgi:pyrroline-5-carboxylate reductase